MDSFPNPLLPPVTMIAFPERSGMSFEGLKGLWVHKAMMLEG